MKKIYRKLICTFLLLLGVFSSNLMAAQEKSNQGYVRECVRDYSNIITSEKVEIWTVEGAINKCEEALKQVKGSKKINLYGILADLYKKMSLLQEEWLKYSFDEIKKSTESCIKYYSLVLQDIDTLHKLKYSQEDISILYARRGVCYYYSDYLDKAVIDWNSALNLAKNIYKDLQDKINYVKKIKAIKDKNRKGRNLTCEEGLDLATHYYNLHKYKDIENILKIISCNSKKEKQQKLDLLIESKYGKLLVEIERAKQNDISWKEFYGKSRIPELELILSLLNRKLKTNFNCLLVVRKLTILRSLIASYLYGLAQEEGKRQELLEKIEGYFHQAFDFENEVINKLRISCFRKIALNNKNFLYQWPPSFSYLMFDFSRAYPDKDFSSLYEKFVRTKFYLYTTWVDKKLEKYHYLRDDDLWLINAILENNYQHNNTDIDRYVKLLFQENTFQSFDKNLKCFKEIVEDLSEYNLDTAIILLEKYTDYRLSHGHKDPGLWTFLASYYIKQNCLITRENDRDIRDRDKLQKAVEYLNKTLKFLNKNGVHAKKDLFNREVIAEFQPFFDLPNKEYNGKKAYEHFLYQKLERAYYCLDDVENLKKTCRAEGWAENECYLLSKLAHPWIEKFRKYFPYQYSCSYHYQNGAVTEDCGAFVLKYSEVDYQNVRIDGNFKLSLNRQISFIAQKKYGSLIDPGFDLSNAFVRFIINIMPEDTFLGWDFYKDRKKDKEKFYIGRVIVVVSALTRAINNADVLLLNEMIEDFIRTNLVKE